MMLQWNGTFRNPFTATKELIVTKFDNGYEQL